MADQPQTTNPVSATDDVSSQYNIPAAVRAKFPDLIALIIDTESMNDDERKYWFQILPIMSDEQVQKLKRILINEKEQLAELDRRYQQDITGISAKHESEWDEFKAKASREKIQKEEQTQEKHEANVEEDLLKRLHQI